MITEEFFIITIADYNQYISGINFRFGKMIKNL